MTKIITNRGDNISGHICVSSLFERFHWNTPLQCKCKKSNTLISHYTRECELFSEGREALFRFFHKRAGSLRNHEEILEHLIFHLGMESAQELGNFFSNRVCSARVLELIQVGSHHSGDLVTFKIRLLLGWIDPLLILRNILILVYSMSPTNIYFRYTSHELNSS